MSFSYNPFRHIEIITDTEGVNSLLCDGCGAEITLASDYVSDAFWMMMDHLRDRHNSTPDDFAGWSVN